MSASQRAEEYAFRALVAACAVASFTCIAAMIILDGGTFRHVVSYLLAVIFAAFGCAAAATVLYIVLVFGFNRETRVP